MLKRALPKLKETFRPTLIIVNGENAAGGKGITEKIYRDFLDMGIHAITLGNHAWDNKEVFEFIDRAKYLVRPANYPEGAPGTGIVYIKVNSMEVAVINLQGRSFLPSIDCPFRKGEKLVADARKRTPIIFIDFHAETTSEKQAMGWFLDGRISAIAGTHTHVQTADERILPGGTAYITDAGMTGIYDGIIGVDKDAVLKKFLTGLPARFEIPKKGRTQLNGILVDIDEKSGLAKKIQRILMNDDQSLFQ